MLVALSSEKMNTKTRSESKNASIFFGSKRAWRPKKGHGVQEKGMVSRHATFLKIKQKYTILGKKILLQCVRHTLGHLAICNG